MNEIEEVKQRIDIVDLINQYVALKKAGANYKGVCPFHQEKTPSMMVSPQKQIWKCFGCGRGGDAFKFVMEAESLEFGDALRLLATKAGVTLQPRTNAEHQTANKKDRLYRINLLASRIFQKILNDPKLGADALNYLKSRKLDDKTIKEFGVGFAPKNFDIKSAMLKHGVTVSELSAAGSPDRFFNRIMFPIQDVLGNVIAFTGRSLGDTQPKYLNSPETSLFNKSRIIYGLNFAKNYIKEKDYVVLVEGQMDVISLHQGGVKQAVASSGTAITERQLQILSKYTNNFLIAFDNDIAGKNATKKVIELLLKNDLTGKVVDFGAYKDAGEMFESGEGLEKWKESMKNSLEGVEWCLAEEIKNVKDINFVENKKKIIKEMLPLLSLIQDETKLDHYVQRVSLTIEAKPESVYAALEKVQENNLEKSQMTTTKTTFNVDLLTNEEQLIALVLDHPELLEKFHKNLEEIVWQSVDASRIAMAVISCYTSDQTNKVKDQIPFPSQVKNRLDSQRSEKIPSLPETNSSLAEKIDAWLFWVSSTWPNLSAEMAEELATEKIGQLSNKKREQQKESLANKIRLAQEKKDFNEVKKLMEELNLLTKQ